MRIRLFASSIVAAALSAASAGAAVYNATPSNYKSLLPGLRPGDVLNLGAGAYPRLYIDSLRGTPTAWITITGPASGSPARIVGDACCNTVEIVSSSYLAIRNLTIDSMGIDGVAGISAKDGSNTHDILIENNMLVGNNASQQTDGISTKIATWNWTIRGNTIIGAGTGMYLGNSSGDYPFVAGTIENNLIQDTIGYNLQIKWQLPRPSIAGMPTGQSFTIIRNNVFIKNDQPSPDGDRPNVLLGGFPDSGPGSTDMYEVYGNFFYHNPREALFQASGRVSVHDNVFVDGNSGAAVFANHDLPLKLAYVYNNTVYTSGRGIYFASTAATDDAVVGNLVFAGTPISGAIRNQSGNTTDAMANAGMHVTAPSLTLGAMDFYPLAGKAQGTAFDLSKFAADPDYSIDFNGTPKNAAKLGFVFRGAYAGEGVNPGWKLQATKKNSAPSSAPALAGLACAPTSVQSGQQSACVVSMTAAPASATSIPVTSSNGAVTVPPSVTIPAGATMGSFSAVAGTISTNATATITVTLPGTTQSATATLQLTAPAPTPGAGALSGSMAAPSGPVNLTAEGTADWTHWGLTSASGFDQKAGVPHQISNYTLTGSSAAQRYANNSVGYTWTDGTPAATATNSTTGVFAVDQGNGFRITAPADPATRTLKVYVGAWRARGRMVAHLSDSSAADYTDLSLSNAGGVTTLGVYTLTYAAASAGQTLTVTFTQDAPTVPGINGNVTLQAATLAGGSAVADFALAVTPSTQTAAAGKSATYNVAVGRVNGFTGTVTLSVSGLPSGATSAFSPATITGSGTATLTVTPGASTAAGSYALTLGGVSGAISHTAGATLTVSAPAAVLTGSMATPTGPVQLTTEGKKDWTHWGLATVSSFNQKAGVTHQISNYTLVGSGSPQRYGNNSIGFTWTDGTPTVTASNSTTGVFVIGQGNGFRLTAPADGTTRTLKLYVGAWRARGRLTAHLSDGSAVDYTDTSLTNSAGVTTLGVYTLTYTAASAGQTLTVTYTQDGSTISGTNGNVTIQAATLQ